MLVLALTPLSFFDLPTRTGSQYLQQGHVRDEIQVLDNFTFRPKGHPPVLAIICRAKMSIDIESKCQRKPMANAIWGIIFLFDKLVTR